jgi:hypothetical protein
VAQTVAVRVGTVEVLVEVVPAAGSQQTSTDWRLVTVTGPVTVDGLLTAVADAARRELVLRA